MVNVWVIGMGDVVVCVVWGLVSEVGCWLKKVKAGTDSLKVDGVAKVLSREAEF